MHDDEQKMLIPGTYLELADNHKTYLELLNLVCYLDDANSNGRSYGDDDRHPKGHARICQNYEEPQRRTHF